METSQWCWNLFYSAHSLSNQNTDDQSCISPLNVKLFLKQQQGIHLFEPLTPQFPRSPSISFAPYHCPLPRGDNSPSEQPVHRPHDQKPYWVTQRVRQWTSSSSLAEACRGEEGTAKGERQESSTPVKSATGGQLRSGGGPRQQHVPTLGSFQYQKDAAT